MKPEVTFVPKDKCPLDVLAEFGERTKNAWIFLHLNVIAKLNSIADDVGSYPFKGFQQYSWLADFHEASIQLELIPNEIPCKVWWKVYRIDSGDIEFHFPADDPDEIFFLKMEE